MRRYGWTGPPNVRSDRYSAARDELYVTSGHRDVPVPARVPDPKPSRDPLVSDDNWIMDTDGTHATRITDAPRIDEFDLSWRAT